MRKFSAVMLAVVAVGWWAAMAEGHPRWGMRGMSPGMMGDGGSMLLPLVLKGVDLTPEQETRVQEIMAAHRPTLQTLFQQMRETHEELSAKLFTPGDVQEADLTPYLQRTAQLREQLMQEGLKVALEVRSVLTAEQLAKAAALKSRMKALHSEWRSLFKEKN
jgi:Spy/CpxP family protein refolding chaperone